jgi:hypothetical protein
MLLKPFIDGRETEPRRLESLDVEYEFLFEIR